MIEALNIISALFAIASTSYIIYFVRFQNSYNHSIINANRSRTPNITKPEMQKPDFIPPAQLGLEEEIKKYLKEKNNG